MTKEQKLMNAIGNIDDEFILEAADKAPAVKKKSYVKWIALAACLCLCVGAVAVFVLRNGDKPKTADDVRWREKYVEMTYELSTDSAYEKKWDELKIYEQYSEATLGNNTYTTSGCEIEESQLGKKLSVAELVGYDIYEDKYYYLSCEGYEITGINTECAVAIELETDKFYVYRNSGYKPETLGDFVNDLSLEENLVVGGASFLWYDHENEKYRTVVFEDSIDKQKVFEMLFSDLDAQAVKDYDLRSFEEDMGLSVSVPKLGHKNISLAVTKDGYLTTNILSTGKAFYIGTDKTEAFSEYVKDNYEGFVIIYVDDAVEDDSSYASDDDSSAVASTVVSQGQPAPEIIE